MGRRRESTLDVLLTLPSRVSVLLAAIDVERMPDRSTGDARRIQSAEEPGRWAHSQAKGGLLK
ncbi:MAG TPA: hypothetical protein VFS47_05395 [Steroidobacteraceae bacterium]|nr:hypothetical protein [Steroidobacteraceae bacterium]